MRYRTPLTFAVSARHGMDVLRGETGEIPENLILRHAPRQDKTPGLPQKETASR